VETCEVRINPSPRVKPDTAINLRIPHFSCSFPANKVAKAKEKLVIENVIATELSSQLNLLTKGWLNKLHV